MMKGSQSISDLTNAMEDPNNSRISEHSGTVSAQGKNYEPYLFLYYVTDPIKSMYSSKIGFNK